MATCGWLTFTKFYLFFLRQTPPFTQNWPKRLQVREFVLYMLSTWFLLFWTFPILFVFKIILIIFNIFVITSFIIVILIITKVFQRLNKTKQADQWTVRKIFDQPWQSFSPIITGQNHNKAVLLEKLKVEGSLMIWTFEIQGAPHITFITELRLFS